MYDMHATIIISSTLKKSDLLSDLANITSSFKVLEQYHRLRSQCETTVFCTSLPEGSISSNHYSNNHNIQSQHKYPLTTYIYTFTYIHCSKACNNFNMTKQHSSKYSTYNHTIPIPGAYKTSID